MSGSPPDLVPEEVEPGGPLFREIAAWPFPESPFYAAQVKRLLNSDLPQQLRNGEYAARMWAFRDPAVADGVVGFGCLTVANYYAAYTGNRPHCYIPLLAKHPAVERGGIGKAIVAHLEAAARGVVASLWNRGISEFLFLDVYCDNVPAWNLYAKKFGFETLNENEPIPDPDEGGKPYFVMAKALPTPPGHRPAVPVR